MNPKEDKLSKKSTQNKEMKSTAKNIMASPTKKAPAKAMGTPLKSTTKKMPAAGTNTLKKSPATEHINTKKGVTPL